jgi:hypothetical protein
MLKTEDNLASSDSHSVQAVDSYIQQSQNFVGDIRGFVKERADIEKTYSAKLKTLFVKYSKENKKTSIYGSARDSVNLAEDGSSDLGSLRNAFSSLLVEMEGSASKRLEFSEQLSSSVMDSAKSFVSSNEATRKRQSLFLQNLHAEKVDLEQESILCRQAYLEACSAVKMAQDKSDKTSTEKQNKVFPDQTYSRLCTNLFWI